MNITDAAINAIAVWFVLKAVEVVPFAIYDVLIWAKERFREKKADSSDYPQLQDQFDKSRGKLEFIFSGAGFLQFSACQRRKKLFFTALLVPVVIFVLEILSIFLGDESRACQTSRDPSVVKAPALRLFGEGKREVNVVDLNNEIYDSGRFIRPCFQRQSTHSGVEYIASICSDFLSAYVPSIIVKTLFPENQRISIAVLKSFKNETVLLLDVFSRQSKSFLSNFTRVGAFHISSEVSMNGKGILVSDVIKDFVINETFTKQIVNDVRVLERARNSTPSDFMENPVFFMFEWDDMDNFLTGAMNVIFALMSQSRPVELKTAAELSSNNISGRLPELDISCEEDFFLPRRVSIIIIITAIVLRLLLMAIPTSISSSQFALQVCQEGEARGNSANLTKERIGIAVV